MARYIMEEMPDLQKTGKRITYPKFARIDNASIKELAQRVGDVSGFSAGDIEGVLLQTAIEMAHLMAEGRSVKIDGIGTFTPSLTLGRDKEREDPEEGGTHRNAQSIFIGGVNFRVDREMVRNISERCQLERAPWKKPVSYTSFPDRLGISQINRIVANSSNQRTQAMGTSSGFWNRNHWKRSTQGIYKEKNSRTK